MALSSKVIADLKKKSAQARKKDLTFFFFEKGADKKPLLILGVKAAARKEKDAMVKTLKRAPTARGLLRKNEITDGLYFRVENGALGPLRKALKGTYKGIPLLKDAPVHNSAPQPQVGSTDVPQKKEKLTVKSLLKGGPKAFNRRADKVSAELAEIDQLLGRAGFTTLRKRHTALSRQLASARAEAQTAPRAAYQTLKTVKDRARRLTQVAQAAADFERQRRIVRSRLQADLTERSIINNSTPVVTPFMAHVRNKQFKPEPIEFVRALKGGTSVQAVFTTHNLIDANGAVRPSGDFDVNVSAADVQKVVTKATQQGWGAVTGAEVLKATRAQVLSDLGPIGSGSSAMGQFVKDGFAFKQFTAADIDLGNVATYTAQLATWRGLLGM